MSEPKLERRIGLGGAILLSFNGIVGASIFALPAALLTDWGSFSPFMFLIVGIFALLVIVPFANSAASFPQSGGPATYGLVYGRFAAFDLGWIFYVSRVAGFGANTNVLVDYVARWWTVVGEGLGRVAFILALWASFALINILGMKRAIRILGGFTLLKALPLIMVAAAALIFFGPPPSPKAPATLDAFEAGFLIIFYAFVGFENSCLPAGETKNPRKTLPRAIIMTTIVTAALYFLVQLAFVSVFTTAPEGSAPLVDLGDVVAGPTGAVVLTLAAICSLVGNLLAGTAATPRITYVMGERGDLPAWFGAVNAKFVSPANSIAFLAVLVALLAVSGSFVWLAVVSTLARMIVYVVTISALPRAPERPPIRTWHWLSGAIGIAVCVWAASQADLKAWTTLAVLAAVGLVLYAIASRSGSSARADAVSAIQPPPSSRDPS